MTEKKVIFKISDPPEIAKHRLGALNESLCAPAGEPSAESGTACANSFGIEDIVRPYLEAARIPRERIFEIAQKFAEKVSSDSESETETVHVIDSEDEWKEFERASLQMDLALIEAFAERSGDIETWLDATPELVSAMVRIVNLASDSFNAVANWRSFLSVPPIDNSPRDFLSYLRNYHNHDFPEEMLKACEVFPKIDFSLLKEKAVTEKWLSSGSLPALIKNLVWILNRSDRMISEGYGEMLVLKLPSKIWGDIPLAFIALAKASPESVDLYLLWDTVELAETEAAKDILWPYFYGNKPASIIKDVLERGDSYKETQWGDILRSAVGNGHPYAQSVLRDIIFPPRQLRQGEMNWRKIYESDFEPFFYGAFHEIFRFSGKSKIPSVNRFCTEMRDRLTTIIFTDSSAYAGSLVWLMICADEREYVKLVQSRRTPTGTERPKLQFGSLKAFIAHPSCSFEKLVTLGIIHDTTYPFFMLAKAGYDEVLDFAKGFIRDGTVMAGFALEMFQMIIFNDDDFGIPLGGKKAFVKIQEEAKRYLKEEVPERSLVEYLEDYERKYTAMSDTYGEKIRLRHGFRNEDHTIYKKDVDDFTEGRNQVLFDQLFVWGRRETVGDEYSFDSLYKAFAKIARSKFLSSRTRNRHRTPLIRNTPIILQRARSSAGRYWAGSRPSKTNRHLHAWRPDFWKETPARPRP